MVRMNDEHFLNLALQQAEMALSIGEVPVGCVVVKNNEVILESHNLTNFLSDPLAHAEYLCVKKLLENFSNELCKENNADNSQFTFYITIEPCVMCFGVLERLKVKVVYGYENEIFGTKKLLNKSTGICLKDQRCVEIIKEFYKSGNPNLPI